MHRTSFLYSCSLLLAAGVVFTAPLAAHAAGAPGGKVVYVAGDTLVINRATDGITYSYKVTPATHIATGSGEVAVATLKPGTTLTGDPAGSGRPVDDVSTVKGKVVSISPPNTLLVSVAGENKQVILPSGTVSEAGKDVPVAFVKAGDEVDLTMVVVRAEGDNRPLNAVKAPAQQGSLALFMEPNLEMPDSGSSLPIVGVCGAALLAVGCLLGLRRRA